MSMTMAVFVGMGAVVAYGVGALVLAAIGSKKRHRDVRTVDGHNT
ncbi:MAG: hypothetical protein ACYDEV_15110 [Acidiferrobacter sp.]